MNQLVKLVGDWLHLHQNRWIVVSHTPAKKRAKNMNQQLQRLDRKRVLPEASEISMSTVKHLHPDPVFLKSISQMKGNQQRKIPSPGTVICIPMRGGVYAYAVVLPASRIWLYNYVTNIPTFDAVLCLSAHWFQHLSCMDSVVGADTFDIGHVELSEREMKHPKKWRHATDYELQLGHPTPYVGIDPDKELWEREYPITEAELPQYQEYMILTPKKLLEYLEANRHRLRLVQVDPSKVVQPPSQQRKTFDPVSVFEIWLSGLEHMKLTNTQEIADEIDVELEKHSAGEVVGTGQTDGQDQHNIAVQNAPGKNKQALACIHRVLKRLKADPETTDIWEQKPDAEDHIKHSL